MSYYSAASSRGSGRRSSATPRRPSPRQQRSSYEEQLDDDKEEDSRQIRSNSAFGRHNGLKDPYYYSGDQPISSQYRRSEQPPSTYNSQRKESATSRRSCYTSESSYTGSWNAVSDGMEPPPPEPQEQLLPPPPPQSAPRQPPKQPRVHVDFSALEDPHHDDDDDAREGWRQPGFLYRRELWRRDQLSGQASGLTKISSHCPLSRYLQVSEKVQDLFLNHSVDTADDVVEAWLLGQRLQHFLSAVLPQHDGYQEAPASVRDAVQGRADELAPYVEQLALVLDQHVHAAYISQVLQQEESSSSSSSEVSSSSRGSAGSSSPNNTTLDTYDVFGGGGAIGVAGSSGGVDPLSMPTSPGQEAEESSEQGSEQEPHGHRQERLYQPETRRMLERMKQQQQNESAATTGSSRPPIASGNSQRRRHEPSVEWDTAWQDTFAEEVDNTGHRQYRQYGGGQRYKNSKIRHGRNNGGKNPYYSTTSSVDSSVQASSTSVPSMNLSVSSSQFGSQVHPLLSGTHSRAASNEEKKDDDTSLSEVLFPPGHGGATRTPDTSRDYFDHNNSKEQSPPVTRASQPSPGLAEPTTRRRIPLKAPALHRRGRRPPTPPKMRSSSCSPQKQEQPQPEQQQRPAGTPPLLPPPPKSPHQYHRNRRMQRATTESTAGSTTINTSSATDWDSRSPFQAQLQEQHDQDYFVKHIATAFEDQNLDDLFAKSSGRDKRTTTKQAPKPQEYRPISSSSRPKDDDDSMEVGADSDASSSSSTRNKGPVDSDEVLESLIEKRWIQAAAEQKQRQTSSSATKASKTTAAREHSPTSVLDMEPSWKRPLLDESHDSTARFYGSGASLYSSDADPPPPPTDQEQAWMEEQNQALTRRSRALLPFKACVKFIME